nr:MAG TPA: hypothetical protein [Caudoviricetes sp.]
MRKQLITAEKIKTLGRPIGKMVAENKLDAYINEAEKLHVKPLLGDNLYLFLLESLDDDTGELKEETDDRLKILLDGGIYNDADYDSSKADNRHQLEGLRVALSYFVYAENTMSGDFESTRFGTVTTNNNYSTHISRNYRSDLYNNAIDKAKAFMDECLTFCKVSGLIKEQGKSKVNIGGCTIRKIG